MKIKFLRTFILSLSIFLIFLCKETFAQCGVDGTQPCTTTKKTSTKKTTPTKTTVTKPKTTTKIPVKTTPNRVCSEKDNFNNNDAPGSSSITINGVKFEFVGIPSGSFCMGSNDGDTDEKPVHKVIISRPFLIGKYEVTQAQWQAVMGSNPSLFSNCGGDCPVENVPWDETQDFLRKLNSQGKGTYRLPTEAEWEYAARAGSPTKYSYGNDESSLGSYAWFNANAGSKTHPVGQKLPNNWGLYDMHGNVWEWCQDRYDAEYYEKSPITDPKGPGSGSSRVYRSLGWDVAARYMRSAKRGGNATSFRGGNLGFRVVMQ